MGRLRGTYDLKRMGGLLREQPRLAGLFLVAALSLAGLPPLSGFFSKYILVRAGIESEQYLIVAVSLVVSLLTLFSMLKIWNEAFWKPALVPRNEATAQLPSTVRQHPSAWLLVAPVAVLVLLSIALGLFAEGAYTLVLRAAEIMLNPEIYRAAVLGR